MTELEPLDDFAAGIVLASASPRRRALLESVGLPIRVRPVDVDEAVLPEEAAGPYVERVARAKGRMARRRDGGWLGGGPGGREQRALIAADTTVSIDNLILGKPASVQEARSMLLRMAGRRHVVLTAVYAATAAAEALEVDRSEIEFRSLTEAEIEAYIATGEPFDKAGGYGIQGYGGTFVSWLSGTFSGVAGLPLARLETLLRRLAIDPWGLRRSAREAGSDVSDR
ncbi:MAG: Maf family protein [Pseudomonadota bacterium]